MTNPTETMTLKEAIYKDIIKHAPITGDFAWKEKLLIDIMRRIPASAESRPTMDAEEMAKRYQELDKVWNSLSLPKTNNIEDMQDGQESDWCIRRKSEIIKAIHRAMLGTIQ